MNTDSYSVTGLTNFGTITAGDQLVPRILASLAESNLGPLTSGDIVVIASKVISIEESRRVSLAGIEPSLEAEKLALATGKDPRIVHLILAESNSYRLATQRGPIIALHKSGLELTSAGIDKDGSEGAFLLPADPDASARRLLAELEAATAVPGLAVVIADSDGRPHRHGSTVIAIGSAAIAPLRETEVNEGTKIKRQQETLVDLIAAAAGVVLGQRGRGVPVAIVRGVTWLKSPLSVRDILH